MNPDCLTGRLDNLRKKTEVKIREISEKIDRDEWTLGRFKGHRKRKKSSPT